MRTLTVLLLVLVLVAGAEIVTFQPDATVGKDATIANGVPDGNMGGISVVYWGTGGADMAAAYIEFVELNESQYQGATVNGASLCWYLNSTIETGDYELGAYEASWNEDTITWNTRIGVIESFSQPWSVDEGWITIDVTDYVQNWLDGTWNNYGFCLYGYFDHAMYTAYSSDYTDDTTLRPKLILDYSGAAVEETTWGEIKASF